MSIRNTNRNGTPSGANSSDAIYGAPGDDLFFVGSDNKAVAQSALWRELAVSRLSSGDGLDHGPAWNMVERRLFHSARPRGRGARRVLFRATAAAQSVCRARPLWRIGGTASAPRAMIAHGTVWMSVWMSLQPRQIRVQASLLATQ